VSSLSASESQAIEPPAEAPASDLGSAVKVDGLSVTYRTSVDRRPTLKRMLSRRAKGTKRIKEIEALRDVSFQVPHGTVLGIVGMNGAGKSTLMRTVAGILPPTEGRVEVEGRVSTLLALGVGFNAGLTGRDNVVLGGLAAGLTREQVGAKYEEIADFAELGDFMEMPMRTYSSGMFSRLAFSVAVNMEPDILLIDEALSVGDARFRRKSMRKMRELVGDARTILIVSHGLRTIRRLCDETIWLHQGKLVMQDEPGAVIDEYRRFLGVGDEADEAADEEEGV
jgi:ABC-type polysaccharide/polyol phosphate transport system ATPase subunit